MMNSNEISLSVKDFQIVKSASLTFTPGLTTIIGQSNNGKSALFRAAKSCIYNEPGQTSIRNGCSSYAVGIQMNNNTVIYQKGKESLYKINGNVYQKIGRTQLPEVADALKIKELNLNGVNEQINFWDQMEKPFLLDRSETDLFRFIVDSGKDNNITQALKSIVSDRQNITKEITLTEGMIAQSEQNLKLFEDKLVDSDKNIEICDRVISIGPKIKTLDSIKSSISKRNQLSSDFNTVNNRLIILNDTLDKTLLPSEKISNKLKTKSVVEDIILRYKDKNLKLISIKDFISNLKFMDDVRLNESIDKYKSLTSLITNHHELMSKLQDINNYKIPDVDDLFISNYNKYKSINEIISKRADLSNKQSILNSNIKSSNDSLNDLKEELNKIGICPTCGQPIHD